MRKAVIIVGAAAAVAVVVAVLWPKRGAAPSDASPAAPAIAESFEPVPVEAVDANGLSLTGTVRDGLGNPIGGAEVFLASSAQASLTTVRCSCGEPLLSCPAPRNALQLGALLNQGLGILSPGARAQTDEAGHFRFERLAGVSFTVWATSPRHGAAVHERAAPGDPVELVLPPMRALAGTVTDASGNAVAGARVLVVPRRLAAPVEARSDARGAFDVRGLGEGPFVVYVEAEGFLPFVARGVDIRPEPARVRLVTPRTLEVEVWRDGARVDAMVWLEGDHLTHGAPAQGGLARIGGLWPGELQVSASAGAFGAPARRVAVQDAVTRVRLDLGPASTLRVRVTDREARPIHGARAALTRSGEEEPLLSRSGEGGEPIAFAPIAPGSYVVLASAAGFVESSVPVRVGEQEAEVEIALQPAIAIRGRVLDLYGRPTPGIGVLVEPTGANVRSADDGTFSADVPSPGLYRISAHHSDFGGGEVEVTAPAEGVELQLDPRAGVRVTVSSEGRRVEGADVILGRRGEPTFRNDRPSGSDGVVLMRGMPAGAWALVAIHPDYLQSPPMEVALGDGQLLDVAVELKAGAALEGIVVDEAGTPIAGASVIASPYREPKETDVSGRFVFRPLPPGRVLRLEAKHPSYDQRGAVNAKAGDEGVRIVMQRREVYRGRVVDEQRAPVRAFRIDEQPFETADGRFELPLQATDGRVMAAVRATGFEPRMIDAPAGVRDLGEIELERLPQLRGVVRDERGAPASGASVTCEACDAHATTDRDGRFELPAPRNVSTFQVTAERGAASGSATANLQSRAPVEIVLRAAVRVSGRAFLESGAPAAGVEVEATSTTRGTSFTAVTMADGTWAMEMPEGTYRFASSQAGARAGRDRALFAAVRLPESWIDLGPVPGTQSLTVRVPPRKGYSLVILRGEARDAAKAMADIAQAEWAQVVFRPAGNAVTLHGVPPGRYTILWTLFGGSGAAPIARVVDVPGPSEVVLAP